MNPNFRQSLFNAAKLTIILVALILPVSLLHAARIMENLNRGVVAVRVNANSVYVGWRMLGTDPLGISFNVYRAGVKLNASPITTSTNYTDNTASNSTYTIRPVIGGVEQGDSETASVWAQFYMTITMTPPAAMTMPDATTCNYNANDCSTADLDGDGQYEIIVKWDPSNSKDNSQSGYTGDVFLDAYKLNGTRLWRIDLGINIRAGAHYTQFMVYDLNSDGKAELACKTAPGSRDSSGAYLSTGPAASDTDTADYRNTSGYILSGPEYLTVFNGQTGREITTVNYVPARGTVSSWGDNYGNRVDRFLACVAYLDGVHPSLVMCRGYYTRAVLAAWDFNGTSLSQRWVFDSNTSGNGAYAGEGNHNLSVGDVDSDGRDEIVYGSCSINDNGTGLYATGRGHGDAGHLGNMNPDRPGLEWFQPHEEYPQAAGAELRDPANGNLLWGYPNTADTGRGLAADIDGNYRGWEMWASNTDGVYNVNGTRISTTKPSVNHRIYWDGDLLDELLDGTKLDKWNGAGVTRLVTIYNYETATENNGTKANPGLTADLLGDWREEMVYRSSDSTRLIIFTTTTTTNYRFYTFMHDFQYRLSVAWQNVAYNQPPHISFYLADGVSAQPTADIVVPGVTPAGTPTRSPTITRTFTRTPTATPIPPGYKVIQLEYPCVMDGIFENTNTGYTGDGYANLNNATGAAITFSLSSASAQAVTLSFRYANGSVNNRNMSVAVNGIIQVSSLDFLTTGAWTTWNNVITAVNLQAGYNTVTLASLMAEGAANLDMVSFVSTTINDGGCAPSSPTLTGTRTRTLTATASRTPSFTGTFTRTATQTGTPSFTRTYTRTITQTATRTVSQTASPTFTNVINSPTVTQSPASSFTATLTSTATQSSTYQAPSLTFTPTATTTRTVSYTATPTASGTVVHSPTLTLTPDLSPSFTATVTLTPVPFTMTPTCTQTPLPPGYKELQAEDACSYDGFFENIHAGYTGTGYANLENTTGSSVLFFVNALSAQTLTLSFRYASGSANERDMQISVNGIVQAANVLFPGTGAWTAWNESQVTANIGAGRNEIMISALTAEGGPNIDRVSFAAADVYFDACVPSPTETPVVTVTETETREPTETVTETETVVPSPEPTASASASATRTATADMSPTSFESHTPSPSASATKTATADASATAYSVPSPEPTFTTTATTSETRTPSTVITATATETVFMTITASATYPVSLTPSLTRTATIQPSHTDTMTQTAGASSTPTQTATLTIPPTVTASQTVVFSPTPTITSNLSPSFTATRTASPTHTLTAYPSSVPTATATPTVAPTAGAFTADALIYPNPFMQDGSLNFRIIASRQCSRISYRIYTCAFRLVAADDEGVNIPAGGGDYSISSYMLGSPAAGTYYAVIEVEDGLQNRAKTAIKPFIIMGR